MYIEIKKGKEKIRYTEYNAVQKKILVIQLIISYAPKVSSA